MNLRKINQTPDFHLDIKYILIYDGTVLACFPKERKLNAEDTLVLWQ